jgi:MFS family permease
VWGASLPRVQLSAGVTDGQLGSALLWVGIGALISIRWAGGLTDRFERWVLPATLAALGATGAAPAFVDGVVALSVALLLLGVASGAADAAINAAAVRAESGGRSIVSLSHGMFSLAVVASSLAVAALVPGDTGQPWSLVVVGAVLVAAATLSLRLQLPSPAAAELPAATPPPVTARPDAPRAGPSRPLLLLGALTAFAYLVENAWQSWGAIQLHATVGASLATAALAPAAFALAAAAGRFGGHLLAARAKPATLFGTGAALAAAGSVVAALAQTTAAVLAGIAFAGLGTSICAPTLIAIAGLRRYGRQGAATSTVITVGYLGFAVGPAAIGLVAGATTLPTALLAVAVIAGALALTSPVLTRLSHVPGTPAQHVDR